MKINDLNKLLDEGKAEEAGNDLLEELGDAAAKPEATKDSPAEEVKPEAEEKKVEEHLEDEHAAESEEVKDVEIKEEIEPVEQPKAEAGEDKPEEAKPEADVKAVKDMQDCKNAEAAEEVEPVEITEDMINEYINSLSDEEVQALNEENLDEFHFKQRIGAWWQKVKNADGKADIRERKHDEDLEQQRVHLDSKIREKEEKKIGKDYDKAMTRSHNNYTKVADKIAKQNQQSMRTLKDARGIQQNRVDDNNAKVDELTKKREKNAAKTKARIDAAQVKENSVRQDISDKYKAQSSLKESIVEDNLEVEPEVVKAEEKHDDGVAEPIAPVAADTKLEVADVPVEQPEKELDDVLNDKLEKEEPAEEKSTYDLVTESLDSILAMLKEEAEAAAKPVATEEKPAEEAKPEAEVKAVKDMQDCENAEEAEEVEPVEITESVKRKYKTQNAGLSHVEVEKEFYTDKIDPSNPERRVHTVRTSVDDVDGSRKVIEDSDKPNSGKSNRDYGKLKEEVEPVEVPEAKKAEDKPEDVCPVGDAKEIEKDLNAEHAAEGEEVKDVEIKEDIISDEELDTLLSEGVSIQKLNKMFDSNKYIRSLFMGTTGWKTIKVSGDGEMLYYDSLKEIKNDPKINELRNKLENILSGTDTADNKYSKNEAKFEAKRIFADIKNRCKQIAISVKSEYMHKYADSTTSNIQIKKNIAALQENTDELSISDMVAIVTEAAKRCKDKGKKATYAELCEEAAGVVGDFEANEFNIDKVLNSKDVAEMGTEKNEKEIEKAGDLHEEAEAAAKPVATEEKPAEEAKPEAEVKAVKDMQDCENAEAAEEINAVEIKESVKYGSIKEACMLDEDYFTTDSYSVDTADKKFSRLTEQVALLMARESNDPMYNELLKEAVYTKRLQEAICEKYHSEAEKKACKIAKKNCK